MWKTNSQKNKFSWKNNFFFLFLIIILVFLGINLARTWKKSREINQEITGLRKEIGVLEENKLKLEDLIEYFNSSAYIEEKAREDLGLKKEGEKVVIINNQIADYSSPSANTNQREGGKEISNPKKWWNYFFQ